jgi:hypothetical protein
MFCGHHIPRQPFLIGITMRKAKSGWIVRADENDMLYLERTIYDGLTRSVSLSADGKVDVWTSDKNGNTIGI